MVKLNTLTKKIAYTALMTAVIFVANFLDIPIGATNKISFVIFTSFVAGLILGAPLSFVACVLADLLGCIGRYAPNPVITLASGLWGPIMALSYKYIKTKSWVRIVIGGMTGYLICSAGINTLAVYIMYSSKEVSYLAYLISRAPVQLLNVGINIALALIFERTVLKIITSAKEGKEKDASDVDGDKKE